MTNHDKSKRFLEFHQANPHVMEILVGLAREYRDRTGRDHCGISLLWGVARWELAVRTQRADGEEFRLNDHMQSFYARLIMDRYADLDGFFSTRRSEADALNFALAA